MDFSQALIELKNGNKVRRSSSSNANTYLYLNPQTNLLTVYNQTLSDGRVISIPVEPNVDFYYSNDWVVIANT